MDYIREISYVEAGTQTKANNMTRKRIWRDDNRPLCHSSAPALQTLELLQKDTEADWFFK